MAHFAKIDESNVVLEVLRVNDEDASTEADGQSGTANRGGGGGGGVSGHESPGGSGGSGIVIIRYKYQ